MGFWSKLFGRNDTAKKDAQRLYRYLMKQARNPRFYGDNRVPDTYEGRIDMLTLHIAPVLKALNTHGDAGKRLGQSLFDEMKDDFEIALREEGLTDSGVAKRIKAIVSLFYARVKLYTEALNSESRQGTLIEALKAFFPEDSRLAFWPALSDYVLELDLTVSNKSLGEIAMTQFEFKPLA